MTSRISAHVSPRALIGPGLLIIGTGLLLMRGLNASSSWTHLLAGLIVAGVGAGMVNPPLASTAVGVVAPQQAGAASGINSTFRQVGIATGIAVYGTLFNSRLTDGITAALASTPSLSARSEQIATAVRSGGLNQLLKQLEPGQRAQVALVARDAFAAGLNRILGVAAVLAARLLSLLLIRSKDFTTRSAPTVANVTTNEAKGSIDGH